MSERAYPILCGGVMHGVWTPHIVAVIPLGAPLDAKSRLAKALSPAERQMLARHMADQVIGALQFSGAIAEIAVVSPDSATLDWASALGATPILQAPTTPDASADQRLNDGLALGRAWAQAKDADALLITLGDLPLLTAEEVAQFAWLVGYMERPRTREERHTALFIALAPDRAGQGTNALLAAPPADAPLAFGVDSLARHQALARQAGAAPLIFHSPGLAFDVDTLADLDELRALGLWTTGRTTPAERAPGNQHIVQL